LSSGACQMLLIRIMKMNKYKINMLRNDIIDGLFLSQVLAIFFSSIPLTSTSMFYLAVQAPLFYFVILSAASFGGFDMLASQIYNRYTTDIATKWGIHPLQAEEIANNTTTFNLFVYYVVSVLRSLPS